MRKQSLRAMRTRRMVRAGAFVSAASAAALVGASVLASGGDAQSTKARVAAPASPFLPVCVQSSGSMQSLGDVNARLPNRWCKGQKPRRLALYPVAAARGPAGPAGARGPAGPAGAQGPQGPSGSGNAPEYGVVNMRVSRGGNSPTIWATYSTQIGSPVGATTGGTFRFTCSAAQAPCKVSIAAAVLSRRTGAAHLLPTVLIHKEDGPLAPIVFCEYAQSANNSGALNKIMRVPMNTRPGAITTPLEMGVGSTLDCGPTGQPFTPGSSVKEIWVPAGPNGSSAFYDVTSTFSFTKK
jgi:hypothetical protein